MLRVKRLDTFMLQTFLPLLCMTFFICLFIVLMQFLWRYIDDLVGKGLEVTVIAELLFYAAVTLIPMALPLAVLLASLMTFGNLGEHFELTALKAAGVSLIRSMAPLIVLMALIAVGAFFFQNNALPVAQTKMWTLLFSMRQKSPEVEIPEGIFYDQITGYNIFVEHKNPETGILYGMMIYDMSRGFENSSIIVADSGKLAFTEDRTHLQLRLWQGESFENLKDAGAGKMHNVPYRREAFSLKEVVIPFDANFNRLDEGGMRNQYVGKNIDELQATIDSIGARLDSIGVMASQQALEKAVLGVPRYRMVPQRGGPARREVQPVLTMEAPLDIDSIFSRGTATYDLGYLQDAQAALKRDRQETEFKAIAIDEEKRSIRRHGIEMHKKFTLSLACIIFFFIGAPLGAIIRKGGLGMPVVISVFLFIVYYIIDNTGAKMARDGRMAVWEGMWLSSAVLLPLGVFLTYKAVNDSAVLNPDAWLNFLRRLTGQLGVRRIEPKEVIIDAVTDDEARTLLHTLDSEIRRYLAANPAAITYPRYWQRGYDAAALHTLSQHLDDTVTRLTDYPDKLFVLKLADLPMLRHMWVLNPSRGSAIAAWAGMLLFPIGLTLWILGRREQRSTRARLQQALDVIAQLNNLIPPPDAHTEHH